MLERRLWALWGWESIWQFLTVHLKWTIASQWWGSPACSWCLRSSGNLFPVSKTLSLVLCVRVWGKRWMCVFAGRLEGCGYRFGEGRGAGGVLTARLLPAERSGGGRGGEGKTGDATIYIYVYVEFVCLFDLMFSAKVYNGTRNRWLHFCDVPD